MEREAGGADKLFHDRRADWVPGDFPASEQRELGRDLADICAELFSDGGGRRPLHGSRWRCKPRRAQLDGYHHHGNRLRPYAQYRYRNAFNSCRGPHVHVHQSGHGLLALPGRRRNLHEQYGISRRADPLLVLWRGKRADRTYRFLQSLFCSRDYQ